jgi:hypothetical protein
MTSLPMSYDDPYYVHQAKMNEATDVHSRFLRVGHVELQSLSRTGRPCEACDGDMPDHDWVLMDVNGFVVHCSTMPGGIEV